MIKYEDIVKRISFIEKRNVRKNESGSSRSYT